MEDFALLSWKDVTDDAPFKSSEMGVSFLGLVSRYECGTTFERMASSSLWVKPSG